MFDLTPDDLGGRLLGCADGPASFNPEATRNGMRVVSCDPLYVCTHDDIRDRIDATCQTVLRQTRLNYRTYRWTEFTSVDQLGEARLRSMRWFLDDLASGRRQGRYVAAALPALPFRDGSFDLAVCSHYLFLYGDRLSDAFHIDAIREMARVAAEVRVFPLVELDGAPSAHVDRVARTLTRDGFTATIDVVPYEFQRGANRMMRVRAGRF